MAQQSPSSVDVQEIQFKLHDKFNVFSFGNELRSHINLLSVASNKGLLFVGNPHAKELKDIVDAKATGRKLQTRSVQIQNVPNSIAVSADGGMLSVNYTQAGLDFLQIFSVASFLTASPKLLYNLRLSPEENVTVVQILWNPVLTTSLAVVLSNGALAMYTLKDSGNFEFNTLDKQNQVKCGCWSPKGKQIVLGFPNGKLQQFKPDLTPAKNIICPVGIHPGPFDTIAVHWLSTFQFAVVFLQHGEDMSPSLYIVNAPKGGQPSYINYYDICYSATGPRRHQVNFTHVQQWNLLLMTSANGVEIGILGTQEVSELPTWVQYTLLDEARIEMPLTDEKDETYPIGFAYDTSSSHQLTIGEQKIPVMPMVHVLSTHGHLVSFNFLNLTHGAPDVCSPPPPIIDASGQFKPLDEQSAKNSMGECDAYNNNALMGQPKSPKQEMSFSFNANAVTSTPALKEEPKQLLAGLCDAQSSSIFNKSAIIGSATQNIAPTTSNTTGFMNFNTATKSQSSSLTPLPSGASGSGSFGGTNSGFSNFGVKTIEPQKIIQADQKQSEINKPLYTVPPIFTPNTEASAPQPQAQRKSATQQSTTMAKISSNEVDDIVKQMIAIQINSFDLELKQLGNQSQNLLANIGKPDDMKQCTKRLNDLQEIIEQANDRDFDLDIQHLKHSLSESYAMLAECRTKLDMYNNPDLTRLTCISTFDPINRRQLAKLQSYVATNQAQLNQLQQQIDAQWCSYQDLVRRNSKAQMHIPCLDGIYQRMSKLKDLMARQRSKLNYIKLKLKEKGLIYTSLNSLGTKMAEKSETMESLADSILSMSLANAVDVNQSKLSTEKLSAIRKFLHNRSILSIRPQRPDRVGLKSEVILETKLQTERQSREGAVARLNKMQQEKVSAQYNAPAAVISKPTATKPASKSNFVTPPVSQTATSPSFGLGGNSLFVKTSSAASVGGLRSEEPMKSFSSNQRSTANSAQSSFVSPNLSGFTASNSSSQNDQAKLTFNVKSDLPNEVLAAPQAPISFAAKVVTSETSKPSLSATNSTTSFLPTKSPKDKENKKPLETEIPKTFSFGGGIHEGTTPFGVGGDFKPSVFAAPTSSAGTAPLFGGVTSNVSKGTPFDGKLGSSSFGFGGIGATIGTAPSSTPISSTITITPSVSGAGDAKVAPAGMASVSTGKVEGSVSNAFSPAQDSTTTSTKSSVFSGFGKPVGESSPSTLISSFNFGGFNLTTLAETKSTSSIPKTISSSLATESTASEAITTDIGAGSDSAADSILDSLSICKPTSKEADSKKSTNDGGIFGGSGSSFPFTSAASSDAPKSIFGGTGNVGSATFSFGSAMSSLSTTSTTHRSVPTTIICTTTSTTNIATSVPCTTAAIVKPFTSTTTTFSFSLDGSITPSNTATTTTIPGSSASVSSTPSTTVFSATNVSSGPPSIFATVAPTTTTSIFGGSNSYFLGTSTALVTVANATPSVFGSTIASTSVASESASPSIFGAAPTTTPSVFGTTTSTAPSSANIFGGIPKPDQAVFGSPTSSAPAASGGGLFAALGATNTSPFSSPTASASGGSIFGGGATTGFGTQSNSGSGSIFGGSSTNSSPFGAPAANTGSIFGGAAKPVEGANIFGSPTQSTAATPNVSIFGQNTFGQSMAQPAGSMFGASATSNQPQTTGFGSSSIFGGGTPVASNTPGSIFGGSSATPTFGSGSPGFGSFSQQQTAPAFSSPTAGGSFAQGGASVAQSGFGSPTQSSAFSKPIFGGAATFGAQPSFGGAATFGSPKGFGSFASPVAAAAPTVGGFATTANKNNLFEALGSTETGLSFGNLAQNTNVNASKPSFGGSSFMNYRA